MATPDIYENSYRKGPPGFDPSYLAAICEAKTVFDIGVGYGTPALYEAFPNAKFYLVEPLIDYADAIRKVSENYDTEVIFKAAGSTPGFREIIVDLKDLHKSSFSERTPLTNTGNPLESRTIEVTTLDDIYRDNPEATKPFLLKIDTEGNEFDVLRGAKTLLAETDTVIAEISIAERFEGSYGFEDIVLFMKANGFFLFSFLKVVHVPGEMRPRFADVVFKRAGN